ncbi:MAG: hypothetical protein M3Z66_10910 [Chloroflexota bacterium]|nr:hypothetical protein [Chloroflexota bacterium]
MKRTTIVASEELLTRLRNIADQERVSLAEIIRQGMEWRAEQPNRKLCFVGSGHSIDPPFDIARQAGDLDFEPPSWR